MVVPDAYKSDGDGGLLGKLVGKVVVWRLGADPGGDWVRGPHQTLPAFLHPHGGGGGGVKESYLKNLKCRTKAPKVKRRSRRLQEGDLMDDSRGGLGSWPCCPTQTMPALLHPQ